jgi:Lon protease-like protein
MLPLHVFEPRYRELMEVLTGPGSDGQMGVVLIERGSEVGGGEARCRTGTVAHMIEAELLPDGRWVAVFVGSHRFRVDSWLPDSPYPGAEIEEVADEMWEPAMDPLLADAEGKVREALELATELGEPAARPGFALATDRGLAAWQLCAMAPLGAFDRQRLLEAPNHVERLPLLGELAGDMAKVLAFRLRGG